MVQTGERYTQALDHVLGRAELEPLPAAWHITGSRARDYDLGLLPADVSCDGSRVVRLRRAAGESGGFGALMQSIAATRYLGRRVRFSAMLRTTEVTGWAGLWLRVDGANGCLMIDNMRDRGLRQTTEWTPASTVLDIPEEATELHFGALLSGGGAVDLARPQFGEADEEVTATARGPLPERPQALDFGVAS
jgi:hypothetical protein